MRYEVAEHTTKERNPRGVAYADLATANTIARKRAAKLGFTAVYDNGDAVGVIYSNPRITRIVGVYARAEG